MSPFLSGRKDEVVLTVRVQPRAFRDEVVGQHDNALKIRITATPVAGKANTHLLKFLAKKLKIPRAHLVIQSGTTSRVKYIVIRGITASEARKRLLAADIYE